MAQSQLDQLKVVRTTSRASLPTRATPDAAGYDLYSAQTLMVPARGGQLISTDLQMEIPKGCYGRIASKSRLTLEYTLEVGAGVIDPDYRGIVKIFLYNHGQHNYWVRIGEPIAQIILERNSTPPIVEVEALLPTQRGFRGFGYNPE